MSKPSVFERALIGTFTRVNRRTPWHRLPFVFGLLNLIALRDQLRAENLTDTRTPGDAGRTPGVTLATAPDAERRFRTADGSYNDLSDPDMGMASTRFARNVPLAKAWPADAADLAEPNPREISQRLMRREHFTPASSLNLLAAAWIQFQTHDWFAHGRETGRAHRDPAARRRHVVREPDADPADEEGLDPRRRRQGSSPTYINSQSHWWDASAIYGSSEPSATPSAATSTANSCSRTAACRSTPRRASRSPGSTRTGGWGSGCCTPSSPSSTTRSATG